IGPLIGASALGCNLVELAPGKRAFPFHNHRANEEMFIILEGCGEVRIGEETFPINVHDIISCPAGGPKTAHQIVNSSEATLRYLALSTRHATDIVEYPDSGRFRVIHAPTSHPSPDDQPMDIWGVRDEDADYWDAG
ncbi:cupin domain-containing protein, partial [Rhizobium sp. KVB221]